VRTLLVAVAAALVVTTAASARNPRLEQLALVQADMQLARHALLRAADLGTGWATQPSSSDGNSPPDCPGQDYSKFTITGQAQTQFTKLGASVLSRVEIYKSRAQAAGDFAVDQRPGTAACEGEAVRKQVAKEATGVRVTLVSAKQLRGAKVGQKSVSFRIVLNMRRAGNDLKVYVDLIGFLRDRAAASVVIVAPGAAPTGDVVLARAIDARLQGVA
jgi:hypothetical protein